MKILSEWRNWVTAGLILLSIGFYTSTAVEPIKTMQDRQQCCEKGSACPEAPTKTNSGGSIIWDSMTDNLLFGRS